MTVTEKLPVLVVVLLGVTTEIDPVAAPIGTVVVIWVSEFTVKVAATPLNLTTVAPVKLLLVIANEVPAGPL